MITSSGRGMNSTCGRIILGLLMLAVRVALAQGQGVEVRSLASAAAPTAPGRILSVSFRVTDHTAQAHELTEALTLPAGWTAVVPAATFTLPASGSQVRLLAVSVPRGTPPGDYQISYSVRDPREVGVSDQGTLVVNVPAVAGLDFIIENSPSQAVAGDTFDVTARVVNRGNAAATVQLSGRATPRPRCSSRRRNSASPPAALRP